MPFNSHSHRICVGMAARTYPDKDILDILFSDDVAG